MSHRQRMKNKRTEPGRYFFRFILCFCISVFALTFFSVIPSNYTVAKAVTYQQAEQQTEPIFVSPYVPDSCTSNEVVNVVNTSLNSPSTTNTTASTEIVTLSSDCGYSTQPTTTTQQKGITLVTSTTTQETTTNTTTTTSAPSSSIALVTSTTTAETSAEMTTITATTTSACEERVVEPNVLQQEILFYVNRARAETGLHQLSYGNASIQLAADIRANEITVLFEHERPDGRRFCTVYEDINLQYLRVGENLLYSNDNLTTEDMVNLWLESKTHRENILNPYYEYMNISAQTIGDTIYVVQHFYL